MRGLNLVILRTVGITMLVGALGVVLFPQPVYTTFSTPVVLGTLVVVLLVALFAPAPGWLRRFASRRWLAPSTAVLGGALATAIGELMRYPYGWDAAVVMDIARSVHNGASLPPLRYQYLSLYPNNFPLVVIDRVGIAIGSRVDLSADAVLIVLNGLCVAVTLWLSHHLVRRVAGPLPALVAMVTVIGLVGISPLLSVPYTDLYAMPFLTAVPVLAERAWAHRGWWAATWSVAAGASAAVAYIIKTTPAVIVVALVLAVIVSAPPGAAFATHGVRDRSGTVGWIHRAAVVLCVVASFLVVAQGGNAVAMTASGVNQSRVNTQQSPPIIWWVANGMNQTHVGGRTRWGGYNRSMVNAIDHRTQPEMVTYAQRYIADRWAQRGATGTAAFYARKAVWNWGDATFWAWGEGIDSRSQPIAHNKAVDVVTQVNGFHGRFYTVRMSVAQGVWLALILVAGLGLLRAPVRRVLVLLALTMVAIGAFILIFQGRSRYLFSFVPLIVALSCVVLPWLPGRRRREGLSSGQAEASTQSGDVLSQSDRQP